MPYETSFSPEIVLYYPAPTVKENGDEDSIPDIYIPCYFLFGCKEFTDYTRIGSNKRKTPEHKQAKHTKHPHSLEWHNSTITIVFPSTYALRLSVLIFSILYAFVTPVECQITCKHFNKPYSALGRCLNLKVKAKMIHNFNFNF